MGKTKITREQWNQFVEKTKEGGKLKMPEDLGEEVYTGEDNMKQTFKDVIVTELEGRKWLLQHELEKVEKEIEDTKAKSEEQVIPDLFELKGSLVNLSYGNVDLNGLDKKTYAYLRNTRLFFDTGKSVYIPWHVNKKYPYCTVDNLIAAGPVKFYELATEEQPAMPVNNASMTVFAD